VTGTGAAIRTTGAAEMMQGQTTQGKMMHGEMVHGETVHGETTGSGRRGAVIAWAIPPRATAQTEAIEKTMSETMTSKTAAGRDPSAVLMPLLDASA